MIFCSIHYANLCTATKSHKELDKRSYFSKILTLKLTIGPHVSRTTVLLPRRLHFYGTANNGATCENNFMSNDNISAKNMHKMKNIGLKDVYPNRFQLHFCAPSF